MKKYLIGATMAIVTVCALGMANRGGVGTYQIEINNKDIVRLDTRTGQIKVFEIQDQEAVKREERKIDKY